VVSGGGGGGRGGEEGRYGRLRAQMVEGQIARRGISDERVLSAMRCVKRHLFVPMAQRGAAYEDHPLPIGGGQTISQPYMVAKVTEEARVERGERALEVGSGCGYQAAVLAEMGADVFCIERLVRLYEVSLENLRAAGYEGIEVRHGDGYLGWPEAAPFDVIVVSAAAEEVPQALLAQLAEGGRLVMPVGVSFSQVLTVCTKTGGRVTRSDVCGCVFVPLVSGTGERSEDMHG